jgi:hypothetical protein
MEKIIIKVPSVAKALPFIQIRSRIEPQGPLKALSNILKSYIFLESP